MRSRAATTDADLQLARELFARAEQDEDAGRWQNALDKLRRVAEVRLTAGVRYHVALCEERLGLLATALSDYTTARDQAGLENARDVLRLVGAQMAPLAARVPRLTFQVRPAVANTVVKVDGHPIAIDPAGTTVALDPGPHRVEANAPGYGPVAKIVTLREREVTTLEIALPAPPATGGPESLATGSPAPGAPVATQTSRPSPRVVLVIGAGASALALTGLGIAAYLTADTLHTQAVNNCAHTFSPAADACDTQKTTIRAWDWTAGGAWAGAAAAATLAVLIWIHAPHETTNAVSAHLVTGPGTLGWGGTF